MRAVDNEFMLIYWIIVSVPLLLSAAERPLKRRRGINGPRVLVLLTLFIVMAFRNTCGDFPTYSRLFELLEFGTLTEQMATTDPLYGLFNWVSAQLKWGIHGVNAMCAVVFLGSIYIAAGREPLPLFFTALSANYFFIVVGMGYTRQGVAASLILLSISTLRDGRPWLFSTLIVLASGFHASAFSALPAILFAKLDYGSRQLRFLVRAIVVAMGIYGAYNILSEQIQTYVTHYVQSRHYSSGGALLRSSVTFTASVIFLLKRKEWTKLFGDQSSLLYFALLGVAMAPLSILSSTAADRMGLYLIPFQLIVFARLPLSTSLRFNGLKGLVGICYLIYFYVWLHLGTHSQDLWVPYESILFKAE